MQKEIISQLSDTLSFMDEISQLRHLADMFPNRVVFSTSLSIEDQVITDLIFSNDINIKVFTLDTGRHFEETYKTLDTTMKRYEKTIHVFFPQYQAVETLSAKKGLYSFYDSVEDRRECCHIRKVEPLKRALQGNKVWITGIRAEHSENRKETQLVEYDSENDIIKSNPLLHWDLAQVDAYVKQHNVTISPLYKKGFLSIGCQPCTRAVVPGEDLRSGRWWWEHPSSKECGLHR